ncbi:MAG TPA: hypothetical protein VG650_14270 [Mycobacteriales bacterium]|nr:hypothetical protein [Mycobacteriales bacterium]
MTVRVIGFAAVLGVLAMYCYWSAHRLDGLHARIDAAAAALDAQLRLRSEAVVALAEELPAPTRERLLRLAAATTEVSGLGHDREIVENAVSVALIRLSVKHAGIFLDPSAAAIEVHDDSLRATYARRFYNDTVRDALVVRDRRVVRWLRLAGRAPHPAYFEMQDDELPTPAIPVATRHTLDV